MRLQGYDYSTAGAYFVTMCAYRHKYLFGENADGKVVLNDAGKMISDIWQKIPDYYPGNDIDTFIVMPNHIHGIIYVGAGLRACPGTGQSQGIAPTGLPLPVIIKRFKTMTTKRYIDGMKNYAWASSGGKLWQRNYYDHIIRSDSELMRVREYIENNPAGWEIDDEYRGGRK
jgi:putative transposase